MQQTDYAQKPHEEPPLSELSEEPKLPQPSPEEPIDSPTFVENLSVELFAAFELLDDVPLLEESLDFDLAITNLRHDIW